MLKFCEVCNGWCFYSFSSSIRNVFYKKFVQVGTLKLSLPVFLGFPLLNSHHLALVSSPSPSLLRFPFFSYFYVYVVSIDT